MLLKQVPHDTLDVPTRSHLPRVVEIKPSRVAVLEGSVATRVEKQVKNIAQSQLLLGPLPFVTSAPLVRVPIL